MIGILVLGMALGAALARPDLIAALRLTAAHGVAEALRRLRGGEA